MARVGFTEETADVLDDVICWLFEICGEAFFEPLCYFVGKVLGNGTPELPYDGCVKLGFLTLALTAGVSAVVWWVV